MFRGKGKDFKDLTKELQQNFDSMNINNYDEEDGKLLLFKCFLDTLVFTSELKMLKEKKGDEEMENE